MSVRCIAVAVLVLAKLSLTAGVLAEYSLDGVGTSSDTDTNSVAESFTATGITYGYATAGGRQGTYVTANTADNGDFYNFTVNANLGFELDLNGGSLTLSDRTSRTGTFSYSVFTSADGYAAPLVTYTLDAANIWQSRTVSFSGASFDDLPSITVRLVLNATTSANSRYLYFDDIRLDGTVSPAAVPEPGAFSLVLLGGIAFATSRARRVRRSE